MVILALDRCLGTERQLQGPKASVARHQGSGSKAPTLPTELGGQVSMALAWCRVLRPPNDRQTTTRPRKKTRQIPSDDRARKHPKGALSRHIKETLLSTPKRKKHYRTHNINTTEAQQKHNRNTTNTHTYTHTNKKHKHTTPKGTTATRLLGGWLMGHPGDTQPMGSGLEANTA
jgi:hypothetical protein